ncbi:MAG: aminopeptidase P family protein [Crocinitomicaceae bacterium]|nr:aminopeptidase P family protein [Crocinitomicaceae bacterium]
MNTINDRIQLLRKKLKKENIDALIIPSNDPHQSEYVSDFWKIRTYLSGFDGSAGTLVVTDTEAALWTDSRYFLQVDKQCKNTVVKLHKQSIPHAPEHIPWLCNQLQRGAVIGLDYRLFSLSQIEYIQDTAKHNEIKLVDSGDFIDEIWPQRPDKPTQLIIDHSINHCGETRISKIKKIRQELITESADYNFISSLDEICWLFNIRSSDVDYTPLVIAYAIVGLKKTYLFVHNHRVDENLQADLKNDNIELHSYDSIFEKLKHLTENKKVITSSSTLNFACASSIKGKLILKPSKIQYLKSIKNEVEISNAKSAMIKDGVALTQFLIWLNTHLKSETISEYELGKKLESFRAKQALYKSQSFGAIVGYKSNGAIIHYSAPEENSSIISNNGVLLLDSGAQYENATTDITRVLWLGGSPTDELKTNYTLVLKGYIALETAVFPKGTTGIQLDALARIHLWQHGLNYGHGTGHGIGAYGMVHEPAQGFATSTTTSRGSAPHEENQFTTIEPGFYKEGEFGVRIENVVISKKVMETEYGTFIGLEPTTLCPIETTLINREMMLPSEIDWLNTYHKKVYSELEHSLNKEEKAWLKDKCQEVN